MPLWGGGIDVRGESVNDRRQIHERARQETTKLIAWKADLRGSQLTTATILEGCSSSSSRNGASKSGFEIVACWIKDASPTKAYRNRGSLKISK